jgi:hypothetical protein
MKAAAANFGERADGNLASAPEFIQQCTFAGGRCAGFAIIEKCQMLASRNVTQTDFDCERPLPGSRAHYFSWNDLSYQRS